MWKLNQEHIRLLVSGVCVLLVFVFLSAVIVGYEGEWYTVLQKSEAKREPFPVMSQFFSALQTESAQRSAVPALAASVIASTKAKTFAAFVALQKVFAAKLSSSLVGADFRLLLDNYQSATSVPLMLQLHGSLTARAVQIEYQIVRRGLQHDTGVAVDHIALRQVQWRLTSLASRMAVLHSKQLPGSYATYRDVAEAYTLLNSVREVYSRLPVTMSTDINTFLAATETKLRSMTQGSPSGTTTTISKAGATSSYAHSSVAYQHLHSDDQPIEKSSKKSLERIIVFSVGGGFALLALLVCVVIVVRHIIATYHARQLLLAFRDSEATRNMISIYKPVLQHLRVPPFPLPAPHNDVEKEYHHAAKFMLQLRPLIPQTLFGDLNSHHKRNPNGSWDITAQNIRLEMSLAFCHCTVLTVCLNSPVLRNASRDRAIPVLAEASLAFHAIVEEVNAAGGIVSGFGAGGKVACIWNATNIVEDAAFVAVRTARAIDRRLGELNIVRDLNIASGGCITSNTKIGSRKHVTFIGSPFDVAEKLLLLNEGHVSRLIIDYETYKELPRDQQRVCKPIAVISEKDEPPIVVMSADEDAALKGDQWKLYNTAFTLYQNNMLSESLTEFRKYLALHEVDHCASWLIENVLEPKIGRRKTSVGPGLMMASSMAPATGINPL